MQEPLCLKRWCKFAMPNFSAKQIADLSFRPRQCVLFIQHAIYLSPLDHVSLPSRANLMRKLTVSSYAFCIGDIGEALSHTTGYPFIYVFQNATESVGGTTGFVSVVLVLLVMITISALASSSRQMFAFARDDGLPFSRWLGTVSTRAFCRVCSLLIMGNLSR